MMKKMFAAAVVVLIISFAGCGYTTRSALPPQFKTVYVEPFKNSMDYTSATGDRSIYYPLLEVKVREAVIDRFLFDGNLRIASDPKDADLILKGELVDYLRNPLRYTDNDDVQEYRVQIVTKLELLETRGNAPMWQYNRFIGQATYFLTGAQATSEESAVDEATVDLARRIVERTIENW